jgi:hypothetical protein
MGTPHLPDIIPPSYFTTFPLLFARFFNKYPPGRKYFSLCRFYLRAAEKVFTAGHAGIFKRYYRGIVGATPHSCRFYR